MLALLADILGFGVPIASILLLYLHMADTRIRGPLLLFQIDYYLNQLHNDNPSLVTNLNTHLPTVFQADLDLLDIDDDLDDDLDNDINGHNVFGNNVVFFANQLDMPQKDNYTMSLEEDDFDDDE